MPISSALKVRNKSIRATYATINGGDVHCKKNVPVTPFTPITGLNGKPFVDSGTGDKYYEYYVDPAGAPLPAGLVLNSRTGQVTGTPTTTTVVSAAVFGVDCKFAVRDSRNKRAYKESTVTFIITDTLTGTPQTDNKINGVVNQVVVDKLIFTAITGGRPPYTYSVSQGELPPDIDIDQTTGKLTGTPSDTKRTYTDPSQTEVLPITSAVLIEAKDFYGEVITASFDFDIIDSIIAEPHMDATDSKKNFVIKGVIPLTINYNSFLSVVAGTPPYTYFTSTKQKDPTPAGITLNATTGVVSGTYSGASEYKGTLQISVKDSTNAIAAKIAKVDVTAYLPFTVVANNKVAGADQTTYEFIELKSIDAKPLKGQYGDPPYTFSVVSCKYTSKTGVVTTTATLPTGLTLTASDGSLKSTAGLATGSYEITFSAVDAANSPAVSVPKITLQISDAVVANSLVTVKTYEMYVGTVASPLTTGFDVISAELGIPPYTFKVEPALPAGLTLTTLPTKCFLNGIPTEAVDQDYVFSVKDSTGMSAKYTETIHLKIVAHLTSSANVTDIEAFIDDLVEPVDIFDSITGGYPPYTVKLLTGTLRPELSLLAMGFKYYDTAAGKEVEVDTPKVWGNLLISGAGSSTPILGIKNIYGYVSQDTYTFSVSDSKGEVSPNIATLNFNIFKKIRGVASKIPPVVTGIAEFTKLSFKPITPIDGVPPFVISATKSITDRSKKPSVKTSYPSLGLKPVQPDTIAGTPNAGYSGYLYYYLTDKTGGRTDNIPVRVEITPKITAVPFTAPAEIMYVRGFPKYEVTDKSGATPVVTLVNDLKYPLFKSVSGGATPYVYYETDSTGKVVSPSKLPAGSIIDSFGNLTASSVLPVTPKTTIYCAVADANLTIASDIGSVKLTINDELSTELVDNIAENAQAVTSFTNTKSNTMVTKRVTDAFTPFKLVKGKNGSGRYSYMFDLTTVSAMPVLDYFQIDGTTGEIKLKPTSNGGVRSNFTDIINVTFGIKVTDTFTNISKVVSNVMRIETIYKMTITAINASVNFDKDSTHSNDPIFTITGGSGLYDFVSCVDPMTNTGLPAPLAFTSTDGANAAGGITGAASTALAETSYNVTYRDRVYGNTVMGVFKLSITSDYIVVPVTNTSKTVNLDRIKTISKLTSAQLLSTPVKIRIEINGNITSTVTSTPALFVNLPTGLNDASTIKIVTKAGSIIGCGGEGGAPSTTASVANGKNGGPGLKLDTGPVSVEVECSPGTYIAGGGGGGGASGGGWRYYKGPRVWVYPTVDYSTGTIQKYDGTKWVWDNKIDSATARKSYVIDSKYQQRPDLSYLYGSPAPNSATDFTIPDPAPTITGTLKYVYKGYTWGAWAWNFATGAGFVPQTSDTVRIAAATYFMGSAGKGGNGFGFNGVTSATAGANGGKDSTKILLNAQYQNVTLTDPSTVNTTKMLTMGKGSATNVTNQYLIDIGILNSSGSSGQVYAKTIVYAEGTDATAGEGYLPGAAGTNFDPSTLTDRYNHITYFAAGGGGGAGGNGGDSGTSTTPIPSDAPAVTLFVAGVGGVAGAAILTAATTPLPTVTTPSLVYGEIY